MKIVISDTFYIVIIWFSVLQTISSHVKDDPIVTVKEGKLRGVAGNLVDGARYYSFKGIPYAAPPVGNLRFKDDPIVTVKEGKLRGLAGNLVDGARYYSFKGIPYAAPPVGNLRFKAPLPPLPWKGIRDASSFGSICTQFNFTYQGNEDCLFLNIYTKSLHKNAKTPVMVFIHGGSYSLSSGDFYLGDFLMQHDVILVTLNYRLELLGFLSLEIPEVPGNAGMKDQVAALRWIQNNIKKFGGDPNSVTIFGESAGAAAVTTHMFSPMSRGLFHKVIAQSGVCISDWAIAQGAKARGFRAGKILGIETNDVYELYNYFMGLDQYLLTNLTIATLTDDERYRGLRMQFLPVVEKKFQNVEAFITEDPIKMLVEGKVHRVPLMVGYDSAEGIISIRDYAPDTDVYNNEPSFYVQREVVNKVSADKLREFGDRLKRFYVGNNNITLIDLNIIANILTDIFFSYNSHRFANLYASLTKSVYMYRFNFFTDLNRIKIMLGFKDLTGVSHADELFYLFYNHFNEYLYKSQPKLREIVFKVTKLWTDFAKTGHPTPDNYFEENWEPYTVHGKEYYNIDNSYSLGHYSDQERIEFWDKIYAEAGLPHIH